MATPLDWKDLVLVALQKHITSRLVGEGLEVAIGWRGDVDAARPLLTLEAGDGDYEERPVSIRAQRPKDDGALAPVLSGDASDPVRMGTGASQAVAICTLDYGRSTFPVFCNLWVKGGLEAKARRSRLLSAVQSLAFDLRPGRPRQIDLDLDNGIGSRARVYMREAPRAGDEAEGVKRDQWRATWNLTARHGLEEEREMPLVNEILIASEMNHLGEPNFSLSSAIEQGL